MNRSIARFQARQLGNPNRLFGLLFGPLWNRRNAALNDTALEQLDLQPDDRVLEVGFGGGYLLGRMIPRVTDGFLAGVDISPAMLAAAQRRFQAEIEAGTLDLRCARAESLPFPPGRFNKVCSINSIFYWENVPLGLLELQRVLSVHGRLVLCQTSPGSLKQKGFARHVSMYTPQEMQSMLVAAGFGAITVTEAADRYRAYFCLTAEQVIAL